MSWLACSMMLAACGDVQSGAAVSAQPYVVDGKLLVVRADGVATPAQLPVRAEYGIGTLGGRVLFGAERAAAPERSDAVAGMNLWSANPDGSDARQVVGGQGVLRASAELTADRRIILYLTPDNDVYMLDEDGTSTFLASRAASPTLSEDGETMAYAKLPDSWSKGALPGSYDLHVMKISNRSDTRVTQGFDDAEPIFTPDGKTVLFLSGSRTGLMSFWKVKKNGNGLKQLTNVGRTTVGGSFVPVPSANTDVEWSPNGRKLAFTANYGRDGEVWVLKFDAQYDLESAKQVASGQSARWTDDEGLVVARQAEGRVDFVETRLDGAPERVVASVEGTLGHKAMAVSEPAPDADVAPQTSTCERTVGAAGWVAAPRFRWPLSYWPGVSAYYDNNAGSGMRDWGCGSSTFNGHRGTDILAAEGSSVYAGDTGIVTARVDGCPPVGYSGSTCGGGFGNHVKLQHGNGWYTLYAHLAGTSALVGAPATCGAFLGRSGSSGSSGGHHLHFEVVHQGYPFDDPFSGSCSGGQSFWTNQNGGNPSARCD